MLQLCRSGLRARDFQVRRFLHSLVQRLIIMKKKADMLLPSGGKACALHGAAQAKVYMKCIQILWTLKFFVSRSRCRAHDYCIHFKPAIELKS